MRDDVPAALPLIVFIAALFTAPVLTSPAGAVAGLLAAAALAAWRNARLAALLVTGVLGMAIGTSEARARAREGHAFRSLPAEKFVSVEAPIERDWAARPHVFVLHASRFRAGGFAFEAPLAIYVRFPPPTIEEQAFIRAEGFLRQGAHGRYSLSIKSPRLLTYAGRMRWYHPSTWNRLLANRLRRHARNRPEEVAMIEALLLGRGERLTEETRQRFKRGGTYHLLVFSGLQISLAAAAIALLLRWIGAARASDASLLLFAVIAPAFIGPSAPVSRAGTGIALYAVSRIIRRPTSFENLWCVSALTRLAMSPGDIADASFHLTYAGAGALLFIGKPLSRTPLRWLAYAAGAELAVAPLTLFHFHQFALGGSILTIAMTPIIFVMLIAGALFCATEAMILLDAIAGLNAVCTTLNEAGSPLFGFFTAPAAAAVTAGFIGAIAAVAVFHGRARTAAVVFSLTIPTLAAAHAFHTRRVVPAPEVTFLDVGQGDAILLRSGPHAALVDGGGRADDGRFGEAVLLPLLVDRGVRRLDFVLLSHAHPDHCGGLVSALEALQVGELWISPRRFRGECADRLLGAAGQAMTPIRLLRASEARPFGTMVVQSIAPVRTYRRAPDNNSSVIVRVTAGRRALVLTGDIEHDAERDLAARIGQADVLKVPHHGSRSSTSHALLAAVRPKVAIISCGRRNVFGHPHPAVLAALERSGARTLRTDQHGSIRVWMPGASLHVTREIDTCGNSCVQ